MRFGTQRSRDARRKVRAQLREPEEQEKKKRVVSHHAAEDAGGAHAGNGAAQDEGDRVGGAPQMGGADLEQEDGGQEDGLDAVEGV